MSKNDSKIHVMKEINYTKKDVILHSYSHCDKVKRSCKVRLDAPQADNEIKGENTTISERNTKTMKMIFKVAPSLQLPCDK